MADERPKITELREHLYAEIARVKGLLDKNVAEYQERHGVAMEDAYVEFLATLDAIRDDEIRTAILEINLRHDRLKKELFAGNLPSQTKPHELN